MLGSEASAVNLGESRGRRRIIVSFLGKTGWRVERRWGRDEVENVWITSLSVSSMFEMAATEVLTTFVKTLTCSFQSLVVS